jgi:hypothetical protein
VTTDETNAHYVKQPESRAFYNNLYANGLVFMTTTPNGHKHAKYGISVNTPEKERVPPQAQHDLAQQATPDETTVLPLSPAVLPLPSSQDSGDPAAAYFKGYAERYMGKAKPAAPSAAHAAALAAATAAATATAATATAAIAASPASHAPPTVLCVCDAAVRLACADQVAQLDDPQYEGAKKGRAAKAVANAAAKAALASFHLHATQVRRATQKPGMPVEGADRYVGLIAGLIMMGAVLPGHEEAVLTRFMQHTYRQQ